MKIVVVLLGLALIAFILWWFFGNHQASQGRAELKGDKQEVHVSVNGGYKPETIVLKKGIPAQLVFNRQDPSSCLDQVVFSDFGVHADLPLKKDYVININPEEAGEYQFACGMNMFHGKLIVE
ncbi:hypothetical protein HMPREF9318_00911 [Streptococcus urinalis FB127-CNA-2]|uniref:EfeO-type cupredoxin-like domain-containing protein n=2 Tax=Streptococcus urinalis TaxID=149016 RepID=G5KGP5_9STRE|nr:hypothetical protein STRUR_0067 [Streptococcus urinalis 2285-97]EKS20957.1 hypothetical protein HMPREF9318_00911 [Streptococcus urinalis FB127-CNA-2]VEF30966.1 Cu2+-exporting ATPase [Streptococcus urinalis]